MSLITDSYRELNAQAHREKKGYGTSGSLYIDRVLDMAKELQTQDILDYGCGKSRLADNLPFKINQYDPAIEKYSALPRPANIVVCTDVLEHVEPECLRDVLFHIESLTKKSAFFAISTMEARKTLADGRNAHLIVKPHKWWLDRLFYFFDVVNYSKGDGAVYAICNSRNIPDRDFNLWPDTKTLAT